MSLFLRRYREMSRRSTTAFWIVMSTAALSLVMTVVAYATDYSSPWLDAVTLACNGVMFVALLVLGISLMRENRRRAR